MFKIISLILTFSTSIFAGADFWNSFNKETYGQWHNQRVVLSGKIISTKKHIRSRDNFYIIKLQGLNVDKFIEVKLYTVKKYKTINVFECTKGDILSVAGVFKAKIKNKQLGYIDIKESNKKITCLKNKIQD
ncbi:MAG: hypothetical protein HON90_11280 [Halobacteriovoraceae bacterium]|nr:hypothetical protein [Halobacteriovoraceae bacterium]